MRYIYRNYFRIIFFKKTDKTFYILKRTINLVISAHTH